MDRIRAAAIVLIGLGDKCASDILKNMNPREVRLILEAINSIESVNDADVEEALNEFFMDSVNNGGIDFNSKEQVKNSILNSVVGKGFNSIIQEIDEQEAQFLEILHNQPASTIIELFQDEHPQVLTAFIIIMFNYLSGEQGSKLVKLLPKEKQTEIFKRMTFMGSMSKAGIDALSLLVSREFQSIDKNKIIPMDGIETVANIISYLDSDSEKEIITALTTENKEIGEKIQDRIFPFHRLAELDKKSMQVLLKEIPNEDLIFALKGVDEGVKQAFYENMSSKSVDILKDEMETKGPVKISAVLDAQKKIIRLAKKLDQEEKIILSSKNNPDVVY